MRPRYLSFKQRKHETVFSFARLHPYEQLAVVWLLNAAQDQRDFIQQSFNQSGLLKYIIDARLSWGQQQYSEALSSLNQSIPWHLNWQNYSGLKSIYRSRMVSRH